MKVYLQVGEERYWLIGSDLHEEREWSSAKGQRRTITRIQQSDNGAGWEHAMFADRGGQTIAIDASTTRCFGDDAAAARACFEFVNSLSDPADHPHPWEGDVYLRMEEADGTWYDAKMPDAVVSISAVTLLGTVTVEVGYRFNAGKIVPSDEGEYFYRITAPGRARRVTSSGAVRVHAAS